MPMQWWEACYRVHDVLIIFHQGLVGKKAVSFKPARAAPRLKPRFSHFRGGVSGLLYWELRSSQKVIQTYCKHAYFNRY